MKFKLEITMDNAAFEESNGHEVARILAEVAESVQDDDLSRGASGTLRDFNGNTVGQWRVN